MERGITMGITIGHGHNEEALIWLFLYWLFPVLVDTPYIVLLLVHKDRRTPCVYFGVVPPSASRRDIACNLCRLRDPTADGRVRAGRRIFTAGPGESRDLRC